MSKKLTIKQEAFVRFYIETGNASEAYRRAYDAGKMKPTTINRNAHALLVDSKIATRIGEMQSKAANEHEITIEKLTEMTMATYKMATAIENPSAAVAAVLALGKLHGLIIEKKQVNGDHRHHHTTEPLSESAEWLEKLLGTGSDRAAEKPLPN